jgi:hypothetical protein
LLLPDFATGLFILLTLAAPAPVPEPPASHDPDEGTLSSVHPRIPEPLVFDLVRPLGAKRGELEVNSLFRLSPRRDPRHLLWAPEVEYAFADGYGIELELPMEDTGLESVKMALQGTLPGPSPRTFIHGWQGIFERSRHDSSQIDLLYLAGARWHPRWSGFTMTGLRLYRDEGTDRAFLGNYSLFYHAADEMSFGLESNLARGSGRHSFLLMPQLHVRRSRYNVQGGVGALREDGATHVQLAWRISREF